jgi:hypothetical protein
MCLFEPFANSASLGDKLPSKAIICGCTELTFIPQSAWFHDSYWECGICFDQDSEGRRRKTQLECVDL